MEIFEKIGDAATKTYKFTAEKTSKIAKETKIKMQINEYKSNIKDIYVEIGENVYETFIRNEEINEEGLKDRCKEIQEISDKIVECKNEILKLNEKRQCKNCYAEIEISANYCPNCGFKQEEEIEIAQENNFEEEENN